MAYYFEFVCAGNRGRSPVAELIGRRHLRDKGFYPHYDTRSSGSHVNDIASGSVDGSFKRSMLELALKRNDIYSGAETDRANSALLEAKDISLYYNKAMQRFAEEEARFRNEALSQYGIGEKPKTFQEQTRCHPDTTYLFISHSSLYKVLNCFNSMGLSLPPMFTLIMAATGKPGDVSGSFGRSRAEYFSVVEKLIEYVPMAIDNMAGKEFK